MKSKRVELQVPPILLAKFEDYQKRNGIHSRAAAILELARIGLDYVESKK